MHKCVIKDMIASLCYCWLLY